MLFHVSSLVQTSVVLHINVSVFPSSFVSFHILHIYIFIYIYIIYIYIDIYIYIYIIYIYIYIYLSSYLSISIYLRVPTYRKQGQAVVYLGIKCPPRPPVLSQAKA